MRNLPIARVGLFVAALMAATLFTVPSAAEATPAPIWVTSANITNGVRASSGTTSWFADISHLGAYSTSTNAFDGSSSLELDTPNANDQVRILNSYGAGVTTPTIPEIMSGGSYTYSGSNVDFQIELFFTPTDPQYGPGASSPCTAAGASYPGMCYTVLKWEPLVSSSTWSTVDLSADTALGTTGGWGNTNRVGIYAKPGPLVGATMTQYLSQMSNYQVLAVGVALGTNAAGGQGFVKTMTYDGQQYNFRAQPPATAPDSPTNVTATPNGNSNVTVSWAAPINNGGADITGYNVNIYSSDGTLLTTKTAGPSATDLTISDADFNGYLGYSYYATVSAVNSVGTSTETTETDASTFLLALAPDVPGNVTASTVNSNQVTVSWSPAANNGSAITSYTVKIYDDTDTLVGTVPVAVDMNTVTISGSTFNAVLGATYYAVVSATNAIGESDYSAKTDSTTFTIAALPPTPDENNFDSSNTGNVSVALVQNLNLVATIPSSVALPGDTVYGFAYSTPTPLGAAVVAADGTATWVNATADLPAGNHRLAVTKADGTLLGWAPFVKAAAATPSGTLPVEGVDPTNALRLGFGLLSLGLVVFTISMVRRRRLTGIQKKVTV